MDRLVDKMARVRDTYLEAGLCKAHYDDAVAALVVAKDALADELLAENENGDPIHSEIRLGLPIAWEDFLFDIDEEKLEGLTGGEVGIGHCLTIGRVIRI